jgi:tRNA-specific 2-thiouridylase
MPDASCRVELLGEHRCHAIFDAPQWAPTPGQYLVLYDGEVCLGGGVITAPAYSGARAPAAVAHAAD